jgi:hypothetical protein
MVVVLTMAGAVAAQTKGGAQTKSGTPQAKAAPVAGSKVEANLAQLMQGVLYPASNIVFAAQSDDPAKYPPAKDPSLATDLLASSYGKWAAVENSALALAESANLLTLPGRKCSNGAPVPTGNADWSKFVQGLRDAGMKAYAAAQAKDMDKVLDAADTMTTACANCHDKYREKPTLAERCK